MKVLPKTASDLHCCLNQMKKTVSDVPAMKLERRLMQNFLRKWLWAYQKIRSWECGPLKSAYRALVYALRGHSGYFFSHGGRRKSCIHSGEEV